MLYSSKSPQISCVPSSKLISTPNRNRDTSSPKKDSPPSKSNNSMKTVIPVDIMAELDKMPNLSSESTPTKKQMIDESDDCIEIIDSPQVKVSEGKGEVVEIDFSVEGQEAKKAKKSK